MKKFLLLVILLLTLLPQARVSAQNWVNESMHECEDDGFTYMTDLPCEGFVECREMCPSCESYQDCEDMESHLESCKFYCSWCGETMTIVESRTHNCQEDEPDLNKNCVFCGMPLDLCICSGPEVRPSSGPSPTPPSPIPPSPPKPSPPKPKKPKKDWTPGDYLFPDSCQTFFKDSLMIMPRQSTKTDCVSAALADVAMWVNDYPVSQYDNVKTNIEANFNETYGQSLKTSGVGDSIIVDFIAHHSGLVVGGIDINGIKNTLDNENPSVTILIVKFIDKGKPTAGFHLVPIIGYDCDDNYLYIDPIKEGLQTCTKEDIEAYPSIRKQSALFAIY